MTKKGSSYSLLFLLVVGVLVSGGCKKEEQPQAPPPVPPKRAVNSQSPVQKQQSSAKGAESLASQLDFANRKDPFKPFVAPQAVGAKPPVAVKSSKSSDLLPIQSYDVSKFKVAGIIIGLKENRALVIDPAGKGYVVGQGMLIGNNDGRISNISASAVDVVENYRDDNGHIRKRTIKLTLPQKK